jgi:hypothetical protein
MANKNARSMGGLGRTNFSGALPAAQVPVGQISVPRPDGSEDGALAAGLSGLSSQFSAWADRAAKIEGDREGAIAGANPDYKPSSMPAWTIRGQAFEQAATRVYKDKLDAQLRTDVMAVYDQFKDRPSELNVKMAELKKTYLDNEVFPELKGNFEASFDRMRLPLARQATQRFLKTSGQQAEASFRQSLDAQAGFISSPVTTGFDDISLKAMSGQLEDLSQTLQSGTERGLINQVEARRILKGTARSALTSSVAAEYDNRQDLDEKEAFVNQIEEALPATFRDLRLSKEEAQGMGNDLRLSEDEARAVTRDLRRQLRKDQDAAIAAETKAMREERLVTGREAYGLLRQGQLDEEWIKKNEMVLAPSMRRALEQAAKSPPANAETNPGLYARLLSSALDEPDEALREATQAYARGDLDRSAFERVGDTLARMENEKRPWANETRRDMMRQLQPSEQQDKREAATQLDAVAAFDQWLDANPNASMAEGREQAQVFTEQYRSLAAKLERSVLPMPRFAQGGRDNMTAEALPSIAQRLRQAWADGQITEAEFLTEVDGLKRWQDVNRRLAKR